MTRGRRVLVALFVAGLAACGGDAVEPLLGVWQVTTHNHHADGCDVGGVAVADPPFIELMASVVNGHDTIELVACTTPMTCAASAGVLGRLYVEQLEDGRRAEVFTAFGDATDCALAALRSDARLAIDGSLRIETRTYETRDLSGVICEPKTARTMFASLTCRELDVITATAVTPAP